MTVTRRDGAKVFSREYTVPAVTIPRRYADSLATLYSRHRSELLSFYHSTMPSAFPPVQSAVVGTDGTIWVWHWPAPDAGTVLYTVLYASGNMVGSISLPRSVLPDVVSRATMWAVVSDSNGVDSVLRYRVR